MKLWLLWSLAVIQVLTWNAKETMCLKILALLPIPSPSHHIWNRALTRALASRGHHVTVVTPDPEKHPVPNHTEIIIEGAYDKIHDTFNYETMSTMSYIENSVMWFTWGQDACEYALGTDGIKKLKQLQGKETFDLIIIDLTVEECFLAFAPIFGNPPIIAITAYVSPPWYNVIVGNPQILSYTSTYILPYTDSMNFPQRILNFLLHHYVLLYREFVHLPIMDDLVRKHLGETVPVPSEIEKNISLVMVNTHFSLDYPRPIVPAMIEVGGMQVKPGKDLPKDIKKFLDEAKHGAIFFSLGTNIRSEKMAKEKVKAFADVFSELPQRVLWKWESNSFPNQPKNVMLREWLPQNDILAHPNVILFITHAGMLSTQEAMYHGVPVVGMPFIADQHVNIVKLASRGLGELLVYDTISKETVSNTLKKVLNNPSYKENMRKMSALFRDQPELPLERAVFWTEYVARHHGASHLRARSADMPWYEYFMLDVMAVIVIALVLVLAITFLALRTVYRFLVPSKKNRKSKQQ